MRQTAPLSNNCESSVKLTLVWEPVWDISTDIILSIQAGFDVKYVDITDFARPQKFQTRRQWFAPYYTSQPSKEDLRFKQGRMIMINFQLETSRFKRKSVEAAVRFSHQWHLPERSTWQDWAVAARRIWCHRATGWGILGLGSVASHERGTGSGCVSRSPPAQKWHSLQRYSKITLD